MKGQLAASREENTEQVAELHTTIQDLSKSDLSEFNTFLDGLKKDIGTEEKGLGNLIDQMKNEVGASLKGTAFRVEDKIASGIAGLEKDVKEDLELADQEAQKISDADSEASDKQDKAKYALEKADKKWTSMIR